jgi:NADP-dependent 3-hydroxy acid dehydrogenase YdfG
MKQVVLITGGNDGLGQETARKLAPNKQVVILGKDKDELESVAKETGCDFVVCNLQNFEEIEPAISSIVGKYGRIDCLINNAGVWIQGPLSNNDLAKIKEVIDVNTTAVILATKAVIPALKEQKEGKIINVISQGGLYGKAERSVYTASKWALTGFTKCMEAELAPLGISVSGFYPGPMKTRFFAKAGTNKDVSKYMELSDVVSAIEFLVNAPKNVNIPELGIKPIN